MLRRPHGLGVLAVGSAAALVLAGCGAASDSTVASCLKNALANQVTGGHNCADSTGARVLATSHDRLNVTCTHQNGNEYICDVTGSATTPVLNGVGELVEGGFYNVTFDGKSIVYQHQGP